ncbi:PH domain-containing protein [Promicromonospora thailandica]|uniref:PH domain-containing protein n=1 Tax=Promicromonospora thailandica TaxID=765201 RepID=A0A9X2GA68_9MICO|nr:PH domain-containing protein [Promicromonospora thailandica]MCP2265421.1 PH domain-containing protein [Promicromonospora thailandica]BFF16963.1 PH domain-containing protein [Promicromonospora thailandica]
MAAGSSAAGPDRAAHRFRTFRGRFGTPVAYGLALLSAGGCTFVALAATGQGADTANRVAIIVFGLLGAVIAWRFGAVRAIPDPEGLTVVNYASSRRLAWPEIVTVRFGPNDPWVHLDLADGDVLAVMGIQRADGEHGMAEARRLVALVAELGEAPDRT